MQLISDKPYIDMDKLICMSLFIVDEQTTKRDQ